MRSFNLEIQLAILALFIIISNCFTVDMYSGANHVHYETSKSNDTVKPGTSISVTYPDNGITYNMSYTNITSLEKALDFIASTYNNQTHNENKTQIVLDKTSGTTQTPFNINPKKYHKYVYNHGNYPYPYPEKKQNSVRLPKKVLSLDELSLLLNGVKGNGRKDQKKYILPKDWLSDFRPKRIENQKFDKFLKTDKTRRKDFINKPNIAMNNRKPLKFASLESNKMMKDKIKNS